MCDHPQCGRQALVRSHWSLTEEILDSSWDTLHGTSIDVPDHHPQVFTGLVTRVAGLEAPTAMVPVLQVRVVIPWLYL
jgi:hypothetical protein